MKKLLILSNFFLKSVSIPSNPCSKYIEIAHGLHRWDTGFKKCYAVLLLLVFISMNSQGQSVQTVKWPAIDRILKQNSDTTFIVHFWATWCGPCIKELPDFELINEDYKNKRVKVILVSTDFVKDKNKVVSFLEKQKIKTDVWLINEPDQNAWIDQIDKNWSGGLPATLMLNNKKQKKTFLERFLSYNRLVKELSNFQ